MTPGRHPRRHLGGLDERAELGVLQHGIGRNDSAIRRVARGHRRVIAPRDGLLQQALDAISAHNNVRTQHLSRRKRDARPTTTTRRRRIRLDVAHRRAEAYAHAGRGARETEEHGVVVCAVDVVVLRAVLVRHARAPAGVAHARTGVVPAKDDRGGLDGDGGQSGPEAPAVQEACGVGGDLDAGADVAEDGGGLEEGDAVAGVREGVGCCEAAEACADDYDVEAERCAVAPVELRDFLKGDVGGEGLCWWVVLHVGKRWGRVKETAYDLLRQGCSWLGSRSSKVNNQMTGSSCKQPVNYSVSLSPREATCPSYQFIRNACSSLFASFPS